MEQYDYKKLYDLTSKIYDIGLNWSAWEGVLEYFSSYVKNGKGSVTVRQNDTFEIDIDNFYLAKTWNLGSDSVDIYRRELVQARCLGEFRIQQRGRETLCVFRSLAKNSTTTN